MKLHEASARLSSDRLIGVLEGLGYRIVRQKGSHIRLKHDGPPGHSLSVPRHKALKIGALHGLLTAVSQMRSIEISDLVGMF